ncbi:XRE family transcriptional regulator [Nocardia sp. NPDC051570]|uniref:XRE family transcriptional regulator n=1 Tax=Nocardia sp. NPDC051570 TaxID=3364324 RepID=UPI0037A72466
MPEGGCPETLSGKLDFLWRRSPVVSGLSYEQVADKLKEIDPNLSVSRQYLWQLRTGKKVNPSRELLSALATLFCLKAGRAFFEDDFDTDLADRISEQVELLAAVAAGGLREVMLRAEGLPEDRLKALLTVMDKMREESGLPPAGE